MSFYFIDKKSLFEPLKTSGQHFCSALLCWTLKVESTLKGRYLHVWPLQEFSHAFFHMSGYLLICLKLTWKGQAIVCLSYLTDDLMGKGVRLISYVYVFLQGKGGGGGGGLIGQHGRDTDFGCINKNLFCLAFSSY